MPSNPEFHLDDSNREFNQAIELVLNTNMNLFLTGKAGTGKTTFLKHIRTLTKKNTVVVAPTGVAALRAGGTTIHSFFQVPFGPFVPDDIRLRRKAPDTDPDKSKIYDHFAYQKNKQELLKALELLIIDEVSMMRCDLLDVIDRLLRTFSGRYPGLPFGGVQIVLIGDTFQLPPIVKDDEWGILEPFYPSPFFFDARVIRSHPPVYIELKKIYRQSDNHFIDLLNRIRVNEVTSEDIDLLNSKLNPGFKPKAAEGWITLATNNSIVDEINNTHLNQLDTPGKTFRATISGTFPAATYPTDDDLLLKPGTQVMFIRNDWPRMIFNGKIGEIREIRDKSLLIMLPEGREVEIEPVVWDNMLYSWNEQEKKVEQKIIGTFKQFPLKLAWAITVHKSQGLTFERVIADLGSAFSPGQVYVALSRCTSFEGLVLRSRIEFSDIITSKEAVEFAGKQTPPDIISENLPAAKAEYLLRQMIILYRHGDFDSAVQIFTGNSDQFKILEPRFSRLLKLMMQKHHSWNKLLKKTTGKLHKLRKKNEENTPSQRIEIKSSSLQKEKISAAPVQNNQSQDVSRLLEEIDFLKNQREYLYEQLNNKDFYIHKLKKRLYGNSGQPQQPSEKPYERKKKYFNPGNRNANTGYKQRRNPPEKGSNPPSAE